MLDKFKGKVLNNNDSNQKDIENSINDINKQIKKLNGRVKKLEKENNSYHRLFKTLYLDYELTPKGAVKATFDISQVILNFVDNVCKKHDIVYWLDYGNLMGAVRHGGFIPWDDDMDIGMMRTDFDKFYAVVKEEFKRTGLDEIITMTRDKIYGEKKAIFFIQISIQDEEGRIFGGLDVFPYDYLIDDFDGLEDKFEKSRQEYRENFFNDVPYDENIKDFMDKINLSFDKQKYIISSTEGPRHKRGAYNFKVLETDKIFPLSEVTFSGCEYPCPNDTDYYLEKIYGDYMDFPKVLRFHNRLIELRKTPNLDEISSKYISLLKKANDTF